MLKSIELWDFESHEHTLIDDLSEGLNLIVGESNAGKTAIIRGLRLVAYNEFDPDSLRVGAKHCIVKVTTDKGIVKVTRGPKDNLWEIWEGREEKGKPDFEYDKVGRVAAPPKAVEIIGLSVVKLGDVNVPVNIMDQMESHFMLAGIGDDKATGSVRAQIIDEISGLSGIESVIKGVSLDNHRAGREMKQIEVRVNETSEKLHDDTELDREGRILESAKDFLEDMKEAIVASDNCEEIIREWESACQVVDDAESRLSAMPDVKLASGLLQDATDATDISEGVMTLWNETEAVKGQITDCESDLEVIPDIELSARSLNTFEKTHTSSVTIEEFHKDYLKCCKEEEECQEAIDLASRANKARPFISKAEEAMDASGAIQSILQKELEIDIEIKTMDRCLRNAEEKLNNAIKECDEILQSITVCPLTLAPVSEECLKEVRT